jgi:hypothetical protein
MPSKPDRDAAGTPGTREYDALIGIGTAAAVLLVSAIAAVVSYVHIDHLAVTHGQPALAGALLPLSIDGTVAAASLAMLRAARCGRRTPGLARFMLGLSVAATLAANVAYGLPFGPVGALVSGWPAVAFVGSAEMALGMVRRFTPAGAGPTRVPDPAELAAMSKADAIRVALGVSGGRVISAVDWLAGQGIVTNRAYVHDVRRGVSGKRRRNRPDPAALAPSANGHGARVPT